ncbi:MAG TPA: HAD hydrolase-like protein [Prolixibacteraceae bacterium]|jgi:putative hydrolase of the HAD superfamily
MNHKGETINTLFLDIGGVLLSSGWGHIARRQAAINFKLDQEDTEDRHQLTFGLYEAGMLTLDEYLNRVVFHQERNFTKEEFKAFMFGQSSPVEGSIEFFKSLKSKHLLKVIAVNNEARELNDFRIQKYKLDQLFDAFVSSCYVHLTKPDIGILEMACGIAHASPPNILYIDDKLLFVEIAQSMGIQGYHFQALEEAKLFIQAIRFS